MSTLTEDNNPSQYVIRAYKPGLIRVNEQAYTHSLIVSPETLIEPWEPQTYTELTPASFQAILALKPDILLIGTGDKMQLLSVELYGELINAGIGVEVMDTSAACRTFNALTAEYRHVAAALLIR